MDPPTLNSIVPSLQLPLLIILSGLSDSNNKGVIIVRNFLIQDERHETTASKGLIQNWRSWHPAGLHTKKSIKKVMPEDENQFGTHFDKRKSKEKL